MDAEKRRNNDEPDANPHARTQFVICPFVVHVGYLLFVIGPMNPVLFLNGTSSAGKTTVARQLQKLWEEPSLYASIDSFIFMFPDHVLKNDAIRKVVLWPLISAFNRSLPNLAECGFPLIVDHVMESPVWMKESVEALG
jgi:hypothetical protein